MVETLTESFCERCGTRYEFKAPTRLNPLRKTRGLFGGLKNYLTSQDDISDAIGDAMRSEEDRIAAAQLDAFHESFNFCIDCRQYTCVNCWNDDAGRCRSCVPVPGTDDLTERLAASFAGAPAVSPQPTEPMLGGAWPSSDLPPVVDWPQAEVLHDGHVGWGADPDPATEADAEPAAATTSAAEPVTADLPWEPEPVAAEVEEVDSPLAAAQADELREPKPEPEPMAAAAAEPFEPVEGVAPPEVVVSDEAPAVTEDPEPWEPATASVLEDVEPEPVVSDAHDFAWPEPEPVAAETGTDEVERTMAWPEPDSAVAGIEPQEAGEPEPAEVASETVAGLEIESVSAPLRVVAWDEDIPVEDLERVGELETTAAAHSEPEPVIAEIDIDVEPVTAQIDAEPQPIEAAVIIEPEIEAIAEIEPATEPAAAEAEPEPITAEAEIIEPAAAESQGAPTEEPIAAEARPEPAAAEAEPVAAAAEQGAAEPEPVAAEAEPEPVHRAPRIAPIRDTILHFPSRQAPPVEQPAAAQDDTPELAARRAQLDLLGLGDPGEGPVQPDRPQPLPYRSRGAGVTPAELARLAAAGSFWEASAREVAAGAGGPVGVQSCGQCGLSLSANARFCRRCGTRQAQSA